MSSYFTSVQTAFLFFPFIALLITLPYILIQYHRFGSIPLLRTTLIYSFVLYLMIMYFLVILPLPSIEEVAQLTTPTMQLIPFHFVIDFLNESGFILSQFSTYLNALKDPSFYTVIFNIFLFMPLGIYLRYYFKCSWLKTVLICFSVSLFFELTQLSGLYGVYPRPYRLFDVDDLIINTFGGLLGFWVAPILNFFLPSREKLDEISYEKGKQVSFFRRSIAFFIDALIFLFINMIIYLFVPYHYQLSLFLSILLYYILFPYLTKGRTLGKFAVQIKVVNQDGSNPKFYQYFLRYGLLYGFFLPIPFYIYYMVCFFPSVTWYLQVMIIMIIFSLFLLYFRFLFQILVTWITKKSSLSHELWSKTLNASTIKNTSKKNSLDPESVEKEAKQRYNEES